MGNERINGVQTMHGFCRFNSKSADHLAAAHAFSTTVKGTLEEIRDEQLGVIKNLMFGVLILLAVNASVTLILAVALTRVNFQAGPVRITQPSAIDSIQKKTHE